MKNRLLSARSNRSGLSASGFVLVTVLIVLVLLVVLVVAFLLRVTTEQTSATGFRGSASARELADMAVGLVQGQIGLATSQGSANTWASQPGMVRTYDQNGNLVNAYKLYSSTNMIVAGTGSATLDITADVPSTTWTTDVALWSDLNAPVQTPSGTNVYPIVDPGATNTTTGPSGFSVTSAPDASANQPIPMPVRWLYVLQDGSLVAPAGSGATATVAGETASNQIIGRIAFWTDDDTCRVNINTASTGTFWDVPRAYSSGLTASLPTAGSLTQEQAYGYYQPVQKEFQRYPGHPAMTDLRAVFPTMPQTNIYNIVPRVVGGGSTQGTVSVAAGSTLTGYPKNNRLYADVDELLFSPNRGPNPASPATALTLTQLQTAKFFLTAQSRAPEVNLFGFPRVACWPVNADYNPVSNPTSPYTTAFDRLIAECSTIGNTGASGAYYPYYFQRQDALNPTKDISIARNQTLYQYLQYLTSQNIPGFGGNFIAKYPSPGGGLAADRDQILTEIFDYIRSTNLYDTTLDTATSTGVYEFTGTGITGPQGVVKANGYVTPSVNGAGTAATQGFGRSYTISKMGIGFICNADGNVPTSNYTTTNTSLVPPQYANIVLGGTALPANQKYIQAIMIPEFYSVMDGFISMWPNYQISVSGLSNLKVVGASGQVNLFPSDTEPTATDGPFSYHDLRPDGTNPSAATSANFQTLIANVYGANPGWRYFGLGQTLTTKVGAGRSAPARGNYPADGGYENYPLIGTPVIINDTDSASSTMSFIGGTVVVTITDHAGNTVQTLNINFPSATFPTPKLATTGANSPNPTGEPQFVTPAQTWWAFPKKGYTGTGTVPGRLSYIPVQSSDAAAPPEAQTDYDSGIFLRPDCDVLRTVAPPHGDYRLVAGLHNVPATVFQPEFHYFDTSLPMFASTFTNSTNTRYDPGYDTAGQYIGGVTSAPGHEPDISAAAGTVTPEATEDYDNTLPDLFPGPLANKPNEGSDKVATRPLSIPYYAPTLLTTAGGEGVDAGTDGGAFFSPNRMMPSPGMFGSLPTGVMAGKPWQTLLFRPQPSHPGAASPSDHLFLDLFWMPVVEPYAISDRFSTAGKINMNYQILPFTYVTRSTGLYALFQSEMVTAIPNSVITTFKSTSGTGTVLRDAINSAQTLTEFQTKFNSGDIFKSASEICNIDIVPNISGVTAASMTATTPTPTTGTSISTFWQNYVLTGDNVREHIYTTLYPRLTTKSNTYTVYYKAQSLKKTVTSAYGTWTEGKDVILGEYRGSAKIERFINANNTSIPDYASDAASGTIANDPTLDAFYRWRVISNRQFAP